MAFEITPTALAEMTTPVSVVMVLPPMANLGDLCVLIENGQLYRRAANGWVNALDAGGVGPATLVAIADMAMAVYEHRDGC